MGKPHKFAWNGIDIETALAIEQIANMAQRAAQESTGDLFKGKQRIVPTRSADRQIEFRINDYLISFSKLMVFFLNFEERGDRTFASTKIEWYLTTQQTVAGFIPVSPKKMVAHHTYVQFARNLADQVRAADPSAEVTLREGIELATAPPDPPGGATAPVPDLPPPPPPPPGQPPAIFVSSSVGGVTSPPSAPLTASKVPDLPTHQPRAQWQTRGEPPHGAPEPPSRASDKQPVLPAGPAPSLVTAVPGFSRPREPDRGSSQEPLLSDATSLETSGRDQPVDVFADGVDDLELTRRANRDSTLTWELVLPDSTVINLDAPSVIGRSPAPPSRMPGVALLRLADHTQSVSKTHAALEVRDRLVWITDLHSTNGTTLLNPAGEQSECPPGQPVPAGDGWEVLFGDFAVRLRGR